MNGLLGFRDLHVRESWLESLGPVKALELFHVVPSNFAESYLEVSAALVNYYFFLALARFLLQSVEHCLRVSVVARFTLHVKLLLLVQPSLEEVVIFLLTRVRESVISYEG